LVAGANDYDYEWQDGSSENTFTPATHGRFWTRAKNQCGEAQDTVTLYSSPLLVFFTNKQDSPLLVLRVRKRDGSPFVAVAFVGVLHQQTR